MEKGQTGYSSVLGEYKPPGDTSFKSRKKEHTGFSSVLGEYISPGDDNVKKKEYSVPYNSAEHPSIPEEQIVPELEPRVSNSTLLKKDSVGYGLEGEYTASVSGSIGKMNSMEAPFPSMTSQTIQTTTMAPNDILLATANANIALSQFPTSVSVNTTQPIVTPVIDPLLNPTILPPGTVQTTTIKKVIPVGTVESTPIITPVQTTTINPILPVGTVHSTISPILPVGSIQTTTINPIVTTKTVETTVNPILTPVQTYTVTTKTTTTEYTTSGVNQFGTPTIVQSVPIGQQAAGATFDTYPTVTNVNGVPSTIIPDIDS